MRDDLGLPSGMRLASWRNMTFAEKKSIFMKSDSFPRTQTSVLKGVQKTAAANTNAVRVKQNGNRM